MNWLLILLVSLGFQNPAWAADSRNPFYEELSRMKEVTVFVAPVTDTVSSGIDGEAFRKKTEEALVDRKSVHFAPAASEADAQLTVLTEIKGFTFSLTDPVDMILGTSAIAIDAATNEHFASLEALVTVRDKSGVRWSDTVRSTITDPTMTEAEARERILADFAKAFASRAFSKKSK